MHSHTVAASSSKCFNKPLLTLFSLTLPCPDVRVRHMVNVVGCCAGCSIHSKGGQGQPAAHQSAHLPRPRAAPGAHHNQPGP